MDATASVPPTMILSNEIRILPYFLQGDPGGIIGPPGLPGPKGEAGPPGKSLPGEPVSTSPFANISLERLLIIFCVPQCQTTSPAACLDVQKNTYSPYSSAERPNLFGSLMQQRPLF